MRDRVLHWLASFVWRAPIPILAVSLLLAGLSIFLAATSLQLNANLDDLIAPSRPFMLEYRQFLDEFGDLESIYAIVENSGDAPRTQAAVGALTAKLRAVEGLPGVYSAIEPQEQLRIATRAMSENDLADLALASAAFPSLLSLEGTPRILREATDFLNRLARTGSTLGEDEQMRLGAAAVLLLKTIASAQENSASRKDLDFLIGADRQPEYFKSDTGRFYFITIIPVKDYSTLSVIQEPLRNIRAAIDQVRREFPDVNIGLTGKPVLQADEMATSNADMTKASIVAFLLCAILFMVMIGGFLRPALALIAFAIGSAWTYGVATLLIGQLNLLSIVFMLVLVGVGLDYGVHVISRYKEFRQSNTARDSITGAMLTAVRGNFTGALTSSIVFFMALFTTFQGLRELGLIAGIGLLLCLTAMTLVLPSLLVLVDRRRDHPKQNLEAGATSQVDGQPLGVLRWMVVRPGIVLIAVALISFGLIATPGSLSFEQNLLNLQAEGLESIEWENRILEDSASATWFGAVIADSQDEALEVIRKTKEQSGGSIGAVRSVFDVIEPQTPRRQELRIQLHESTSSQTQPTTSPQSKLESGWTIDDLRGAITALDLITIGALRQAPEQSRQLAQLSNELKALASQIERDPAVQVRVDQNVERIRNSVQFILEGDKLDLRAALPDALRQQYISRNGRYLVMLHPKENVWEYKPMRHFIADMRQIDPDVTGVPITHFESLGEMLRSFMIMSVLALVAIIVIVALDFRRVSDVVLAMLPLLVGLSWTVEIMGLLGISFNLANFFSVPILIGLGVDSSVHILHRYREGGPTRFSLGGTRRAVILTALTTIIGFGCLIMAHHRGLRSLGLVMVIGSTACMFSSVVILPALLAWLERRANCRPTLR